MTMRSTPDAAMRAKANWQSGTPQIGTSGFSPFVQGLVGGTEFGPLGRGSAGLLYSPAGPLSFMLGVEGAALAFNHQNRWFASTKYGFTYGVLVRL